MPQDSTWEKLQKSMRSLLRIRELGADSAHLVAGGIDRCHRGWIAVPQAPAGQSIAWPPDLRALAEELGFEPDVRAASDIDARMDQRLGGTRPPYRSTTEVVPVPTFERARELRDRFTRGEAGSLPPNASEEMTSILVALGRAGRADAWRELWECHGCRSRYARYRSVEAA